LDVRNRYLGIRIKLWICLILSCLLSTACFTPNKDKSLFTPVSVPIQPINFNKAKILAKLIHADHQTTFYCNCRYDDRNNQVDLQSCGYKVQHNTKRARRIEWEHIVPASVFGKKLPCWNNKLCCTKKDYCYKGRKCCQKIDPTFSTIEADLHNIVPAIGELNILRSNYDFAELPDVKSNQFGSCNIKIDKVKHQIEPRHEVRGIIARAYLYMENIYKISLSKEQKKLFLRWNKKYPPTDWEIYWNTRITKIQGNDNSYISNYNK